MNNLNDLFRARIGYSDQGALTFERLPEVLALTAVTVPFENLCIMDNNINPVTEEYVVDKILVNREGGLCYEINTLLYLFLLRNGLDVVMTRSVVYDHEIGAYYTHGRTHISILLKHEGQLYIIDSGFGGNHPLVPVPLTGETVASANGEFRIRRAEHAIGNYVFEMKLKHKDEDWRTGYTFDSERAITDLVDSNEIQRIVVEHPLSKFNKTPVITRLTPEGSVTLTQNSLTRWTNGQLSKEQIEEEQFEELRKVYFGK
ncbi:arylamine N-acetyltransferase family protein [Paenibacillus sp. MMS18-CY102]|uniref:arylamine N-acetyltransferase family protein n=1 Tax=Paenibacillus sp. MMS18-CY102 TaxID=2682849 RepID=UPI00136618A6|nr:arylamine N-acetyltransferase [Paenibacillus sp. MMS18-CY102]MWC31222.1 arylamine N-acetyltransferase [Paenibacillus sp. MMS18-CY102]